MAKHYIEMSGDHGYLPDHCDVSSDRDSCVESLAQLFDLGRTRKATLKREGYLELTPSPVEVNQGVTFGAEYCEIVECVCSTPWIHSEGMTRAEWEEITPAA
jgi:hypothetical protein